MDSSEGSHPKTRSGIVRGKTNVMVDAKIEPAGEGLPAGWLKEYRPRKNQSGARIRGDMFYIDPTKGYEFRSLKDVQRYLESGEIGRHVIKTPNKRIIEDLHITEHETHHTLRPSCRRQLNTDKESSQCDLRATEANNTLRGALVNPESKGNSDNMLSAEPKGLSKGKLADLKLQKSTVHNQSLEHGSAAGEEANVERKPKEKRHKTTKSDKQVPAPLRASPRLAALKINHEANNVPKDELVSAQTDTANEVLPKWPKSPQTKDNSSGRLEKKDVAHTSCASENAENKYPSAPEQILGAPAFSLTDIPCQNVPAEVPVHPQQNGLAGTGTSDGMPGSALTSLLRNIWSDPCLKFAFKTLTSDIPVLDNTLAGANCFLPSQDLNKGTKPNCSSSAYDGNRNHAQVDRASLPRSRPSDKFYSSGWFPPQ